MKCSGCANEITPGSPFLGHYTPEGKITHIHHQNCLIKKLAKKCICPDCGVGIHFETLEKNLKNSIITMIAEHRLIRDIEKDARVWGAVAGIFGGIVGGAGGALLLSASMTFPLTFSFSIAAIYCVSRLS